MKESRRPVRGGISGHAEYIPELGPEPSAPLSVGSRRRAGYSAEPVSAGGEEVCRKAALNGSGTAYFTPSLLYLGKAFVCLPKEQEESPMAQHILDVLKERGFIAQVTYEEDLYKQLEQPTTFYVGFDPTADSLHIGHYIPIMAMAHMQRAGHKPIALMGGGTAMIGDPSGKTDMRKMMTVETIDNNVAHIKQQMSRFLDFSEGKAIIANNGDWLRHLNFIDFMRDIGSTFSVNKMLTAECYKARMATENGHSFLEFTYMLMQSYDFLELYHRYGCRLQMGGNDQWSNMLGGADLVRRKENEKAFACTFQLLLTHDGRKMGKT